MTTGRINQVTILTTEACAPAETPSKLEAEVYVGRRSPKRYLSTEASRSKLTGRLGLSNCPHCVPQELVRGTTDRVQALSQSIAYNSQEEDTVSSSRNPEGYG